MYGSPSPGLGDTATSVTAVALHPARAGRHVLRDPTSRAAATRIAAGPRRVAPEPETRLRLVRRLDLRRRAHGRPRDRARRSSDLVRTVGSALRLERDRRGGRRLRRPPDARQRRRRDDARHTAAAAPRRPRGVRGDERDRRGRARSPTRILRSLSGERIAVPNEKLAAGVLRNDSIGGAPLAVEVSVWIAPDADPARALAAGRGRGHRRGDARGDADRGVRRARPGGRARGGRGGAPQERASAPSTRRACCRPPGPDSGSRAR